MALKAHAWMMLQVLHQQLAKYVAQETESDQVTKLENIKCRSPRATFEITFYNQTFKMHGQSFDFTVKYKQVTQMFVLPNSTHHNYVVVALDPPLRKGNTMYPHIVAIFPEVTAHTPP
jgi:structure-specific recognition protein 1